MIIESIQWSHPSTNILAGPSNSGKTTLISSILEYKNTLFKQSNLKTILYFNQEQEIYTDWIKNGLVSYSSKGVPSIEDFTTIIKYHSNDDGAVVIFDDLGGEVLSNLAFFEHIFVVLSHHLKISVFLVLHNLFERGLRKISLNTSRIILTSNQRDQTQINYIGMQSFPGSRIFFLMCIIGL
jgi:GTPase SAR1 family protein